MTDPVFWSGDPWLALPPGRPTWITVEMIPPLFTPTVVAQVFFARKYAWLKRIRYDYGINDGELGDLGPMVWKHAGIRSTRMYSLHNIERLIYTLASRDALGGIRASNALTIVLGVARQYGHGEALDTVAREAARAR